MGVHRFQLNSINAALVGSLSEPGLTASQLASLAEIDITLVNDAFLADLVEAMAQFGYSFVASAPSTPRRTANLVVDMSDPGAVPPVSAPGSARSYYDNAQKGVLTSIDGSDYFRTEISPRNGASFFEDFLAASGTTLGHTLWVGSTSGAGSAVTSSVTGLNGSHQGILQMQTGTTATGRATARQGSIASYSNVAAAGGNSQIEFQANLGDIMPTAAEDYTAMLGWSDNVGAVGFGTNSALFVVDRALSATNWIAKTVVGGVPTNTVTAVAVPAPGTWSNLLIDISSPAGARFYVNGALVATHALATLPAATVGWAPIAKIEKLIGTAQRRLFLDYVSWGYRLNPAR